MPNLTTTVDDSSPIFQWVPPQNWTAVSSSSDSEISSYYQSTASLTNSLNSNVSFVFAGHSVQVYGSRSGSHGLYQVQVDNTLYPQADGSSSPQGPQQLLFSEDGLSEGNHTVTVSNLDDGKRFDIDYVSWESCIGNMESTDPLVVKTVQDTDPDIEYQGTWQTNPSNVGTFFGGTGHVTTVAGSSFKFVFTGGAIALVGPSDPNGATYSVQLDDEPPQNLMFHNPQYIPQSILYYRGGLALGERTVQVTHTGAAPGGGNALAINYMQIFTTVTIEASAPNPLPPAAVAGITVGTIVFLLLILISLYYYCIRYDKTRASTWRLFDSGWRRSRFNGEGLVNGISRVARRRQTTEEDIDLDGGPTYAAVETSEREMEHAGTPGISKVIKFVEEKNGEEREMGRSSIYSDTFSDSSKSGSQPTGTTRHSRQQSSLSGLSALNQPFMKSRSSTDVKPGNLIDDSSGPRSPRRHNEPLSRPPALSSIESTPTLLAVSILPASPPPSSPRVINRSPQANMQSLSPKSPLQPVHRPLMSESGLPSQAVPQYPLLGRNRTVALPLPPGAARPQVLTIPETNELGIRTRNMTTRGSVGSRGMGGRGVTGPRTRNSVSRRMNLSTDINPVSPHYQSGPGASGSLEKDVR